VAPSRRSIPYAVLGSASSSYFDRRFEDAADAFVYRGHGGDAVPPDWNALQNDKAYFTELRRRHLIEFGCPLNLETWKRMSRPGS